MKTTLKIVLAIVAAVTLTLSLFTLGIAIAAHYYRFLFLAATYITIISSSVAVIALASSCFFVGDRFIRITFLITLTAMMIDIVSIFVYCFI